jgi:hypothetical protein
MRSEEDAAGCRVYESRERLPLEVLVRRREGQTFKKRRVQDPEEVTEAVGMKARRGVAAQVPLDANHRVPDLPLGDAKSSP